MSGPGDQRAHEVLLVDVLTGGHHYEYAAEVQSRLRDHGHGVDFLGPAPTDQYREFLGPDASFLFDEQEGFTDRLDDHPDAARTAAVERLYDRSLAVYDVVHFLAADTIVEHLVREYDGRSLPAVVLSLNGSFFRHVPFDNAPLTLVSDWLFERFGGHWYPIRNNLPTLSRALGDGPADHITVPTVPAAERLESAFDGRRGERITLAPDPAVPWQDALPDPRVARRQLELPEDHPVLLYFGQMRAEKGVELLVEGLRRYDGDPATVVLAGSPTDVDEGLLRSVDNDRIETVVDDEFVPQDRVPAYFAAADAVVFPYRQTFGRARPSGVFQKACAAHRPTVVPEFGVFRRAVSEYSVGVTFEPGDPGSLAERLASVVADSESVVETADFEAYCRAHSYDHLASQFESVYDRVTAGDL
jgi:glycosyltransferase involved in cell wall biosynthesis